MTSSAGNSTIAIDVQEVTHKFGKHTALDGISLAVDTGEVVAVLGPNGAGKSTLLDVILGLSPPSAGTTSVCGLTPASAVRSGLIGAALQDGGLPRTMTVERIVRTLTSVHPQRLRRSTVFKDPTLNRLKKHKIGELSGGQRQRLRLALATMSNPHILVLDEPSAGLDVTTRSELWSAIQTMADDGVTVLFATHYLTEAERYADRVIVMNAGRIVASGTPEQLTSRYPTIIRASLATRDGWGCQNSFAPQSFPFTAEGSAPAGARESPSSMSQDSAALDVDERIRACLSASDTYERYGDDIIIHTTQPDHVLLHTLQHKLLIHPTVNRAALEDAFSELTR